MTTLLVCEVVGMGLRLPSEAAPEAGDEGKALHAQLLCQAKRHLLPPAS